MDAITEKFFPDAEMLVAQVDEYALYCHYLGYEPWPGKPYQSPVREPDDKDGVPSFAIFQLSNPRDCMEFSWKDFANGKRGDIVDLVKELMALDMGRTVKRYEAIEKIRVDINSNLSLPKPGQIIHPEGFGEYMDLRVKSRPFYEQEILYWLEIGVTLPQLARYNVTAISHSWTISPKSRKEYITYHGVHSYAYRIGSHYQIYQPYAKREKKFRHNFTDKQLPGLMQLPPTGKICIINKAYKETMALDAWGYPGVNARSENTPVAKTFLTELESRFERIVCLFDNDGKHRKDYPYEYVYVPKSSGEKDPTDFARTYGVPAAIDMVGEILKL